MGLSVAGERCIDAGDGGTLVWDPKVVENLTDEECKCIRVITQDAPQNWTIF